MTRFLRLPTLAAVVVPLAVALAGCSHLPFGTPAAAPVDLGPGGSSTVYAVTAAHELIQFGAKAPQQVLSRVPLQGLAPGEQVLGIDFRVSRGVLFALASSGRLFTVDVASGRLTPLAGQPPLAVALRGQRFGVDFNPAADRIRVVSDAGQNLRLHPETGAVIDFDASTPGVQPDPDLRYEANDPYAARPPKLVAAGYTYNTKNDKLTTNYALDAGTGTLVMQGSREDVQPVVSPNTGRLTTVGSLGVAFEDAAFDISDVHNLPLAALRTRGGTHLYRVDLASGRAWRIGPVADGGDLRGMAIAP